MVHLKINNINPRSWPVVMRFIVRSLFTIATLTLSFPKSAGFHNSASSLFALAAESIVMNQDEIDKEYPGTAVSRMMKIRQNVFEMDATQLSADWDSITRLSILKAGGLKDLRGAIPGQGYTGHSFNDYNHCDLTAMKLNVKDNDNNDGKVAGISLNNRLGQGIMIASIGEPDIPDGGSWSTCIIGCNTNPPQDVAHIQFQSRIAFKLVWVPPSYNSFVLVDDDGNLLNHGTPTGQLPHINERRKNYQVVKNSKYSIAADKMGNSSSSSSGSSTEM